MKVLSDQDVIRMLSQLGKLGGSYPSDLLAARRVAFMRQVAQIGYIANPPAKSTKAHGPKNLPPSTGALLETVLVVAIAAEAGTAAFVYRDKLADFIKSFSQSPRVSEAVTHSPEIPPSTIQPVTIPNQSSTPITTATPITTPTVSTTQTLQPGQIVDESDQAQATAAADKSNNGLHLGQTKEPDPQNNNDKNNDNSGQGGDKKPKNKKNP